MQAAVLRQIGQPLCVEDVPKPVPGPDEVLIQTRTCGICRTDLHIQDGLAYVPHLPHVPGHEPAGVVAEVGRDVRGLTPGQAVVPHLFVFDRDCPYTQRGDEAQATHLRGIIGVTLPGGFAEYFIAPARNLLPIPDGVPFDVAGLTSCAVITAVHAFRKAALGELETAAVIGAGGIGLILLQLLGDRQVRTAAVDRSAASLDAARQAGAGLAVLFDDPTALAQLRAFAGGAGGGFDAVFELVGRAETMKLAAAITGRDRRIIVIGEEAEFPAIDTVTLAQRESGNHRIAQRRAARRPRVLELLARGVICPPVAGHFPLNRINEAFQMVRAGNVPGRVIITLA